MSGPKTLLQMAGAPLDPGKFSESAVVVIDAQNEYVTGKLPLVNIKPALDNISILLKAARAAGAPVIHIQHKGRAGGLFDPGADAFKLAPQAASEAAKRSSKSRCRMHLRKRTCRSCSRRPEGSR